jgi:hypothetical protein
VRSPSVVRVAAGATTVAVLFALLVVGFGLWRDGWWPFTPTIGSATVPAPPTSAARYSGVVQVREDAACTGWLLDTGHPDAAAYVVSSGRCSQARRLLPTGVGLDLPATGQVQFGLGRGTTMYGVRIDRVVYTTMNGTDLSVLALATTLGQLQARGIDAYRPVGPPAGQRVVTAVGVPVQGLASSQIALRAGECQSGGAAAAVEGSWFFEPAVALQCPGVVDGSSGSPVFNRSAEVAAVLTTTTAGTGSGGDCALGKPCRLTAAGTSVVPDESYAMPVRGLDDCFPQGRFALGGECPLPGQTLVASAVQPARAGPGESVSVSVTAPTEATVRVGVAPLTSSDACAQPETYGSTANVGPRPTTVPLAVPAGAGRYVACLAEDSGSWARVPVERLPG